MSALVSSLVSWLGAVLDLPRVVEDVPRDAARRVPGQPPLLTEPLRAARRPQHLEHLRTPDGLGHLLARGRCPQTDLADVARLRVDDVRADLVPVAPAAAGTSAKLGR